MLKRTHLQSLSGLFLIVMAEGQETDLIRLLTAPKIATPAPFKPGDDFELWLEKLEFFFEGAGISEDKSKVRHLVNLIPNEYFAVLSSSGLPLSTTLYGTVKKVLVDRFTLDSSPINRRLEFSKRVQGVDESIEAFSEALAKLSSKAFENGEAVKDALLVDQFLKGLRSQELRAKVLCTEFSSFTELVTRAKRLRDAGKIAASLSTESPTCVVESDISKVETELGSLVAENARLIAQLSRQLDELRVSNRQPSRNQGIRNFRCYGCGQLGHRIAQCRKSGRTSRDDRDRPCYKCGKVGHFQRNCPTSNHTSSGN